MRIGQMGLKTLAIRPVSQKPMDFADSYIYTKPGDEFHSFSWYAP